MTTQAADWWILESHDVWRSDMGVQQIHTIHSTHQVAFAFVGYLNVSSSSYFLLEALSFKALLKLFTKWWSLSLSSLQYSNAWAFHLVMKSTIMFTNS